MRYMPLLLSAAIVAPAAHADIQLNGFLSAVGGTATDEPIRNYEKDFTFTQDSIFGLQARADLSDKLSITGQLVSRGKDDFATELAWGYLAYEASKNLTLRMGRFRTPFYFYSDFLEVGYAYPWVAPAHEVYEGLQFDNINGMDAIYNVTLFNTIEAQFQTYFGSMNDEYALNKSGQVLDAQTRNNLGLSATFGIGDFSLRASAHSAKTTIHDFNDIVLDKESQTTLASFKLQLEQLGAAAPTLGVPALSQMTQELITELDLNDTETTFTQIGLKYDGEYLFGVAEATNLDFKTGPAADQQRYFVSTGVNIGSTVLFVSYSEADDEAVDLSKELTALNQNPALAPTLTPVIDALDGISQALTVTSKTTSVGIRYDFEPGAALKLQFDNIDTPDATDPTKTNSQGLVRFGVDLVF